MDSEVLRYLDTWKRTCAYEHGAMSEAQFSSFLEGLINVMEKQAVGAKEVRLDELRRAEIGMDTDVSGMGRKEYIKRRKQELKDFYDPIKYLGQNL